MHHQIANVSGIRLAYETFGDKDNPAILLIHGLGTQMIGWPESLCHQLADLGFYIIRFDNRDVGKSSNLISLGKPSLVRIGIATSLGRPANTPYTVRHMAQDTVALMDFLQVDKAHIVGASMGGMIAQWMGIAYPQRVASLTLMMTSSGRKGLPGPNLKVRMALLGNPSPSDRQACINQGVKVWKKLAGKSYPSTEAEVTHFVTRSVDRGYNPLGIMRQLSAIMADSERCARLREIDRPTLVIHGDDDPMLPLPNGIDLWHRVPNAQMEVIEGWGHDLPVGVIPRLVNLIFEHIRGETNNPVAAAV
ncbi:alpha/beta hydrolase [Maricurvus nonylphenolicus]|uniref:alpha/beta fold hydrolase n=1 Tax=Maricurvus nonylphenolicus TaxID=1008307 RepID=UPI0036F1BBFC